MMYVLTQNDRIKNKFFDIVGVIQRSLKEYGFNVFAFINPLLSLEHFHTILKFSLISSCIGMFNMTGFEFVRKVKEIKSE